MPITVTLVRELPKKEWTGTAKLYKLSESIGFNTDYETDKPRGYTDHVVISTTFVGYSCNRWETYIFPATADGEILDWGEYPGSMNHESSQVAVIENAGWKLTP